jgi:chemotaxis protein methyltransferase CheR
MELQSTLQRWFSADALLGSDRRSVAKVDEPRALAEAIVASIRRPLLVLDTDLCVVTVNDAFHHRFKYSRGEVEGHHFHSLGEGQWNSPELTLLLANVLPRHTVINAYEVETDLPGQGLRTMLLDAREMVHERNGRRLILLTIDDITERRAAERKTAALLHQKDVLLRECQHRVANSLQIIASIVGVKARTVNSEETRRHLRNAHRRILSVAAVQRQLDASGHGERIELASYLSQLCETLVASIVDDTGPVTIEARAAGGTVSSKEAVSLGLIVTELVINAIKHAFAADPAGGLIVVSYENEDAGWRLAVADNGVGRPHRDPEAATPGLGTGIVEALARQFDARVETSTGSNGIGTMVSITHGQLTSHGAAAH